MRALVLTAVLALGCAVPAWSADAATADNGGTTNAICHCGKAVDAKVEIVTRTIEGRTHRIATCSDECAKAAKADPKKAVKAIEAHNRKDQKDR